MLAQNSLACNHLDVVRKKHNNKYKGIVQGEEMRRFLFGVVVIIVIVVFVVLLHCVD